MVHVVIVRIYKGLAMNLYKAAMCYSRPVCFLDYSTGLWVYYPIARGASTLEKMLKSHLVRAHRQRGLQLSEII